MKRIAVTGAAGQIAYSLVFQIANGALFGPTEEIELELLDLPEMQPVLAGVVMELEDCAFPLLKQVRCWDDPYLAFEGVDWALLIGAKPRAAGMERKDLLGGNAKIFAMQGRALSEVTTSDVQVLVVGNPCNTNAWVAQKEAPNLDPHRFYAMTQLDANRAVAQLANRAHVPPAQVSRVTIWGNHSATQVPDPFNARVNGEPIDPHMIDSDFFKSVQQRGAAIIAARGRSSAASAAHAIIETVRNIEEPTPSDQWFSLGVWSDGNPYGVDDDLIYSFPCRAYADGRIEIVKVPINPSLTAPLKATESELIEERRQVTHLVGEVARGCTL